MGRSSHHSTSKVGRRRSQLALKPKKISVCSACKGPTFSHRACPQCGVYSRKPKTQSSNVKSSPKIK